jgi:hypothetical protein
MSVWNMALATATVYAYYVFEFTRLTSIHPYHSPPSPTNTKPPLEHP